MDTTTLENLDGLGVTELSEEKQRKTSGGAAVTAAAAAAAAAGAYVAEKVAEWYSEEE